VNLETTNRDTNIPLQLQQAFGHADMGIYVDVVNGGTINLGYTVMATWGDSRPSFYGLVMRRQSKRLSR